MNTVKLSVRTLYTIHYTHREWTLTTSTVYSIHLLCTHYTLTVHSLHTYYALTVHLLCTHYTLTIHSLSPYWHPLQVLTEGPHTLWLQGVHCHVRRTLLRCARTCTAGTVHCTLYTVHCTLLHYTLYTIHSRVRQESPPLFLNVDMHSGAVVSPWIDSLQVQYSIHDTHCTHYTRARLAAGTVQHTLYTLYTLYSC
jgi:hypothetical protein